MINRKQILKKRPIGIPDEETWELHESNIRELDEGEMLLYQEYISLDPAMRGWINQTRSYISPVEIGQVMRAGSVGKVIKTKGKTIFKEGDFISGWGVFKITVLLREKTFTQLILKKLIYQHIWECLECQE